MRYVETTIKIPLNHDETPEDGDALQNLAERGAGELLHQMGRSGTYWSIRTEDPAVAILDGEVVA